MTRWDAARYARDAYTLGVRYIGGCCGFEPYHLRAMAEELREERGCLPEASEYSDYDLEGIAKITLSGKKPQLYYGEKYKKEYWQEMSSVGVKLE